MATCTKCNGTGYLPQYAHIQGGVCFECEGTGQSDYKPEVTGNAPLAKPFSKDLWRIEAKTVDGVVYRLNYDSRENARAGVKMFQKRGFKNIVVSRLIDDVWSFVWQQ
jgi:hypothetical protein